MWCKIACLANFIHTPVGETAKAVGEEKMLDA
jgi:hypothetical protein